MKIIDHGVFTQYFPYRPDAPPGAGFCRNETGQDWYDLQKLIEPGAALVEVDGETGVVTGKTGENGEHDYSTRWPLNRRLLEVRPAEAAGNLNHEMRFQNGVFEPVPQPARTELFKTDIYSRMSDDELESFDAAIAAASTRMRLMWRDCNSVEASSLLFPLLKQQMSEAFGQERADTILSLAP